MSRRSGDHSRACRVHPAPHDAEDPRARTLGIVLIGVALLIGVVLLAKGFSQEEGLVSTATPSNEKTTTTTAATSPQAGTGTDEEGSTTTTAANAPANVPVLVANGSGKTGVAATNATKLKTAGYTKVDTGNAPTTAKSSVYYAPGAQADAQAVATALGLDQSVGRGRSHPAAGRARGRDRAGGHRLRPRLTRPASVGVVSSASEHSHAPDGGIRAPARRS